jgi:PAS domain S-box-containing protein
VVAHPIPSFVLQQTVFVPPAQGEIGTGLENERAALGVAPVHLTGNTATAFYVITELPVTVALSASIRFMITFIVVLLFTVVGISFFSVRQTRQFSRPIEELADSARDFAAGKLDSRVKVRSQNEIGALGSAFNQMASQLQDTLQGLEQRVAERTTALQTSAEISRRLTSILDPRQLAGAVVNEVQLAYNYYYAQIYLFDEAGENLVLTAGTGEPGAEMLKRGHSLPKGRGLVGRAAETKESILVSDTSQDPNWLPNELLPGTKAEAVVPILVGDKVLGVLDVQDDVTNDIYPEDITLLESLAGQVAISLQNAESYARADAALQEAKSLVDYAAEGIAVLDLTSGLFIEPNENAAKIYGLSREELVKVGPAQMSPARQPDGRDSTEKAMEQIGIAMQKGTNIFEWVHINGQGEEFPAEIRLVRLPGDHPRVRVTVTDITERQALQKLTAQRARQQEAINTITQRIQAATTVEEAMQVAARELGHALGKRQTAVTLEPSALGGNGKVANE